MSVRTLVLIPPSEGKADGGDGPPWAPGTITLPELDEHRAAVLAALGPQHPVHLEPTLPAIERYTGVLYRELDAATIRGPARRRLHRNVLIASGLWGVVAPRDPIPTYRLKMGAKLEPLGTLARWWRPRLTPALAPRVKGAVVWDLLPNEHAAALDWTGLAPRTRVTVRFLDRTDRTVSHWNKLLKGSLVRWLCETGVDDPADIVGFDHPRGYRFDPVASTFGERTVDLVLREVGS